MMLTDPPLYAPPLRIESRVPADTATIHALTPRAGGGTNQFPDLRTAGGVCEDIRRHLVDSGARLVDAHGVDVPDAAWRPSLAENRGGLRGVRQ